MLPPEVPARTVRSKKNDKQERGGERHRKERGACTEGFHEMVAIATITVSRRVTCSSKHIPLDEASRAISGDWPQLLNEPLQQVWPTRARPLRRAQPPAMNGRA